MLLAFLAPSAAMLARPHAPAIPPASVPLFSREVLAAPLAISIGLDSIAFGGVRIDTCKSDSFTLFHTGQQLQRVLEYRFLPTTTQFSVDTLTGLVFSGANDSRVIKVRFCPTDTGVEHRVRLIVIFADSMKNIAGSDTILLAGSGRSIPKSGGAIVRHEVRFDSTADTNISLLAFGSVPVASSHGRWIYIVNVGSGAVAGMASIQQIGTSFTIDSLMQEKSRHITDSLLSVTIGERDSVGLFVRFHPMARGTYSGELLFRGDSVSDSLLITGGATEPGIEVAKSVDAGPVDLDTCVVIQCTIRNTGDSPLVITDLVLDSTHFHPVRIPATSGDTIFANQSRIYQFRFCPDSVGPFNAILTIRSNAPGNAAAATVLLNGSGIRGRLSVDSVATGEVVDGCDTLWVIVHDTGAASITATPLSLLHGDRGFRLSESGTTRKLYAGGTTRFQVIYCSSGTDLSTDTLLIRSGDGTLLYIPLRGVRVKTSLIALRYSSDGNPLSQLDLGGVVQGQQRSAIVYIQNLGTAAVNLDSSSFTATLLKNGGNGEITVVFAKSMQRFSTIAPNGIDSILVTYRADGVGTDSGIVYVSGKVKLTDGASVAVSTTFSVVANGTDQPVKRSVWLADTSGRVGDTLSVAIHVTPPIAASDGMRLFHLSFHYDSTSLYPLAAADPAISMRDSGGVVTVDRAGGAPLSGDLLGTLRFLPLSTAKSVTLIELANAITLEGKEAARYAAASTITLSGCDIGRTPEFNLKVTVGGVAIGQGDESATITYQAPEGRSPSVRLVDVNGATWLSFDLPAGTGTEQSVQVPMGRISPGLYLLELRLDGDRSAIPIMVVR